MSAQPIDDVKEWVDTLDVPPPPDFQTIEEFLATMAHGRGRPIEVLTAPLPPTKVCGLWIGQRDKDTIVVSDQLTGVQRDHVVMHEAAHILLGHHGINRDLAEQVQHCLEQSAGKDSTIDSVLGRCRRYDDHHERAAELLASYYQAGTRGMQRGSWIHRPQARQAAAALFGRTPR